MEVIETFFRKTMDINFLKSKDNQCLLHLCIPHIVSSDLHIVGIKKYLLMPLIIHSANYSTCTKRISMGHQKMNETRSQFQSLLQHHLVQASNSQKA